MRTKSKMSVKSRPLVLDELAAYKDPRGQARAAQLSNRGVSTALVTAFVVAARPISRSCAVTKHSVRDGPLPVGKGVLPFNTTRPKIIGGSLDFGAWTCTPQRGIPRPRVQRPQRKCCGTRVCMQDTDKASIVCGVKLLSLSVLSVWKCAHPRNISRGLVLELSSPCEKTSLCACVDSERSIHPPLAPRAAEALSIRSSPLGKAFQLATQFRSPPPPSDS